MAKSKPATLLLLIQYYAFLLPLGIISYFALGDSSILGIPIFWGITVITWIISAIIATKVSKLSLLEWYEEVFFAGVMPICKYILPWAIYWLLILTVKADTTENYGKYHAGWQWIGAIIPVGGLVLFIVPLIFNKAKPTNELKELFSAKNLPVRNQHSVMETELVTIPSMNTIL